MDLTPIVTKNKRTSNALLRDISRRSSLNRTYEKKTLELLKKSIEQRNKTYNALSKRDKEGGGILGNLLGGSLLLRRFRGRGGRGFGQGGIGRRGIPPKTPRGGGTIGGGVGRFGRFGRIGPLAILGTGLDFAGRIGSGQNLAQATIGAGGGLAGALAGGKIGAAIGTAILPGVGTIAGGLLGSGIGAVTGGNIADTLTGLGSDTRRQLQTTIQKRRGDKTLFSGALDQFDGTLRTLEEDTAPTLMTFKKFGRSDDDGGGPMGVGRFPTTAPTQPFFTAGRIADIVFLTLELGLLAGAIVFPGDAVAGDVAAAGLVARRLAKLRLLRKSSKFLDFSKRASEITKKTKQIENARILFKRNLKTRIFRQRSISKNSKMNKFFRDTPDIIFDSNLPAVSRGGRVRRQGANELLQTRIDNVLDSIRTPKSKLKKVEQLDLLDDLLGNAAMRDRLGALGDASRPDKLVREALKTGKIESAAQRDAVEAFFDFFSDNYITKSGASSTRQIKKLSVSPVGKLLNRYKNLQQKSRINKKRIPRENIEELLKKSDDIPDELIDLNMPLSIPSSVKIPGLAEGGRVEAGTPYFVGEVGKELFVPDVSGDIVPNDDLGPAIIAMTRDPDTIIKSSGGGDSSNRTVVVPASSYDVVAKYAQMTGLFTV